MVGQIRKTQRRSQAERTASTRRALVEATIEIVFRLGYGGATSALIAEAAGVSSGSIIHHFGTRADLMAEVIRTVVANELAAYDEMQRQSSLGTHLADWPELAWKVLSQPSGMAVLEILLAARSDPKLANKIAPLQASLEQQSVARALQRWEGASRSDMLALTRLIVWAARGLSIAKVLVSDAREIEHSVALFQRILRAAGDVSVIAAASESRVGPRQRAARSAVAPSKP